MDLLFFTDDSGYSQGWKLHYTSKSKTARGPSLASKGAGCSG